MKSEHLYLRHMLDAIQDIEGYLQDLSCADFLLDGKTKDAVTCKIMVIGEAANNLDFDFCEKHSEIPWHEIISMRNRLIHGYSEINYKQVWNTATQSIPLLKKHIKKILN
jgi:uncharacterized protein with HEPN domain